MIGRSSTSSTLCKITPSAEALKASKNGTSFTKNRLIRGECRRSRFSCLFPCMAAVMAYNCDGFCGFPIGRGEKKMQISTMRVAAGFAERVVVRDKY